MSDDETTDDDLTRIDDDTIQTSAETGTIPVMLRNLHASDGTEKFDPLRQELASGESSDGREVSLFCDRLRDGVGGDVVVQIGSDTEVRFSANYLIAAALEVAGDTE